MSYHGMEKKSSIAIHQDAKELYLLLNQHVSIPTIEFVLRTQPGESDIGFIQDTNDQYIVLKFSDRNDEIKLRKPYHLGQLLSCIQRMILPEKNNVISIGSLCLDAQHYRVTVDNKEVYLTEKETLLLQCLMKAHPAVVSKQQLMSQVWGSVLEVDSQTLSTHIYRLRQKLGQDYDCIQTLEEGYLLRLWENS